MGNILPPIELIMVKIAMIVSYRKRIIAYSVRQKVSAAIREILIAKLLLNNKPTPASIVLRM
jgi:hypothetical protein